MSINYIDILVSNTEEREEQDKKFNWWLYPFLTIILVIIGTVLIYAMIFESDLLEFGPVLMMAVLLLLMIVWFFISLHIDYLRARRVNDFIRRKNEWYEIIVEYTGRFGKNQDSLGKLEDFMDKEVYITPKKINYTRLIPILIVFVLSLLSIVFEYQTNIGLLLFFISAIVTAYLGYKFAKANTDQTIVEIPIKEALFWSIFQVLYLSYYEVIYNLPINYLWDKLQKREKEFCNLINDIWIEEGWMTEEIEFSVVPNKHRSVRKWGLLSIFTFGIGFLVWDYKLHTDPDNIYPRFYKAEDEILEIIVKNNFR